jgi:hypothetical protein
VTSKRSVIQRPTGARRVVLWPGVILPAIGLLGAVGIGIAGLSSTLHPGAPNHSLGARWAFGKSWWQGRGRCIRRVAAHRSDQGRDAGLRVGAVLAGS